MSRIWCAAPWSHFVLDESNGGWYQPCCNIRYPLQKIPKNYDELMEIWNSQEMQLLREALILGRISEDHPCRYCSLRNFEEPNIKNLAMQKEMPRFSKLSQYDIAAKEYRTNRTVLSIPPIELGLQLSKACNIDCVMCAQIGIKSKMLSTEKVFQLIDNIGITHFDIITIMGGETLLVEDGHQFLDYFIEKGSDTCILIVTNGLLINKEIEKLKKIKNLFLNISIDGVESNYELIRKGGKWSDIYSNLRLVCQEAQKRPSWRIVVTSLIMKHSIYDSIALMRLAKTLGISIYFSDIYGLHDENIAFDYKYLQSKVWEESLRESMAFAQENTLKSEYETLRLVYNRFEYRLEKLNEFIEGLEEMLKQMQEIYFFGAGYVSKMIVHYFLDKLKKYPIKGFIDDTYPDKIFYGYPCYKPSEVEIPKNTHIIIAISNSTMALERKLEKTFPKSSIMRMTDIKSFYALV